MAGGRQAVAAVMVAAACLWAVAAAAAAAAWREEERLRDRPCPSAEDIHPCVCTVMDSRPSMDCSAVQSSHELADVFNSDFPFLDFYKLRISHNQHITDLRVGDFGNATFERIFMDGGVLETVAPGALAHSYNTMYQLSLSENHISEFPFDELTYFTRLEYLHLNSNDFRDFPYIYSNTVHHLVISDNPFAKLNSTALQDLPNLGTIVFGSCGLTEVDPGTFVGLKNLELVTLTRNKLTILRENTVEFTEVERSNSALMLYGNQLTTVEPNAIKVNGSQVNDGSYINVESNQLTELSEDVWRPLLEYGFAVEVRGNPLTCGCDIAWIVLNPDYLNLLDDDAACADGVLVSDLDPAVFEANCT